MSYQREMKDSVLDAARMLGINLQDHADSIAVFASERMAEYLASVANDDEDSDVILEKIRHRVLRHSELHMLQASQEERARFMDTLLSVITTAARFAAVG